MNWGLSEKLKVAFGSDIIPIVRPLVENQLIPAPNWLRGFAAGECCFTVNIRKSTAKSKGWKFDKDFQYLSILEMSNN